VAVRAALRGQRHVSRILREHGPNGVGA